ncbi:MAG: gp53-like domain-containing protein [Planctomycetota bacterium]|jgi:hypothetical protein
MAFTTDWDTDLCSDATDAIQIDDYINKTRTDVEERLKNWVYGFVAGENDGVGGLISAKLKVQTSVTQTANCIHLYGKDVSSKCELHAIDEDANDVQITAGGNIGGANVELLAGKDLLGSATSDITINTNKFTVAGATGNTVIAGTCAITGAATLTGGGTLGAALAAGSNKITGLDAGASDGDAVHLGQFEIDNVDAASAGASSESVTLPNGLTMKFGSETITSDGDYAVTFGAAFDNAVFSVVLTPVVTAADELECQLKNGTVATTGFTIIVAREATIQTVYWMAIGY